MVIEKPEMLKEWLTSTLKKMCHADPVAVGKYIFALVKKDKRDKKEMKTFLLTQLEIFLMDETSKFVELLFDTLLTKSYIKSTVLDDVVVELSSTLDISPSASSQPTKNIKSTLDSTDVDEKELKTKPQKTNDLTDKSHNIENSDLSHKRKSIFDDKHNAVHKKSCKPSYSKETQLHSKLSLKEGEERKTEEYIPTVGMCGGVPLQESRSDLISIVEPSPKKIKLCDPIPHGDTDYRERKIDDLQSLNTSHLENVHKERESLAYSTKHTTRCKDYDVKGYCLRGNFCGYDHGTDPILVEHTPDQFLTSLKAVNFGVNLAADQFGREDTKSPLPPLPTSPPRVQPPPPPPPLPPPTGFAAEPYNPESPGMNMITHLNVFNLTEPPPTSSSRMSSLFLGKADSFYNRPKQERIRELINVTKTIDSSNSGHNKDHRTYLKPLNSVYSCGASNESANHTNTQRDFKAKRFDFSRLGPCPPTSLNVRQIPSRLNTIKNLHQHFSKFDNIVNIEPSASTGSIPRSVYMLNSSPQGVKKVFSKLTAKKGMQEKEGEIATHKMKLHQAKSELVHNAVQHQKLILDQLMKTTKKNEKVFLKKTLDQISKKVVDLTKDLKKDNEELKSLLKSTPTVAAKELLDAELDLYKKQHTNSEEDTTELLLKKVNLMKTKAKALGLIESSSCSPKSAFRRNLNSRYSNCLSIDHRPRKILVVGKKSTDKEDIQKHFKQFGKIEKLDEISGGIVIAFYTRAEAEAAYFYGAKFEDKNLTLSWFNDTQLNINHTPDFSNENPEQKTIEMQSDEVEEEEEEDEEDSGARSWRR